MHAPFASCLQHSVESFDVSTRNTRPSATWPDFCTSEFHQSMRCTWRVWSRGDGPVPRPTLPACTSYCTPRVPPFQSFSLASASLPFWLQSVVMSKPRPTPRKTRTVPVQPPLHLHLPLSLFPSACSATHTRHSTSTTSRVPNQLWRRRRRCPRPSHRVSRAKTRCSPASAPR